MLLLSSLRWETLVTDTCLFRLSAIFSLVCIPELFCFFITFYLGSLLKILEKLLPLHSDIQLFHLPQPAISSVQRLFSLLKAYSWALTAPAAIITSITQKATELSKQDVVEEFPCIGTVPTWHTHFCTVVLFQSPNSRSNDVIFGGFVGWQSQCKTCPTLHFHLVREFIDTLLPLLSLFSRSLIVLLVYVPFKTLKGPSYKM